MIKLTRASSLNFCRRHLLVAASGFALALLSQQSGAATLPDSKILVAKNDAETNPDIESITIIAQEAGTKIGTGEIPMSNLNVKKLGTYMSNAIIAKSVLVPRNNITNKADEIGEVGAYIMRAVANNTGFKNATKAKAISLALLQGVLTKPKSNTALLSQNVLKDVVGSVALTIHNTPSSVISDSMETALKKYLIANAGIIGTSAQKLKVIAALKEGFSGSAAANLKYEDGNIFNTPQVVDPETDIRNG